jgi:hypothetical protein
MQAGVGAKQGLGNGVAEGDRPNPIGEINQINNGSIRVGLIRVDDRLTSSHLNQGWVIRSAIKSLIEAVINRRNDHRIDQADPIDRANQAGSAGRSLVAVAADASVVSTTVGAGAVSELDNAGWLGGSIVAVMVLEGAASARSTSRLNSDSNSRDASWNDLRVLPRLRPISGNFLGPKTSNATTPIKNNSAGPIPKMFMATILVRER